ncbi:type III pantothenate kinase [Hydrogenimonas cancrithermarum]|uniref:Type III pantothenate kinase n=1 Tax=Hydrogenimonas cancrithermarum TaxID=2993563 RepID=A0ABM8FKT0_9BACT|nr:type III pantothenate kinase [Hydrogenimonas cancrithermarum]BDY12279.1 type III pantothenate kinase [Hydrogenimonas cancrithermarum]
MTLCDVGNSRMHFFDNGKIFHLSHAEGIERYKEKALFFICVNDEVRRTIEASAPRWIDLSGRHLLNTQYRGLGVDREAACLGIWDGVVIDAGSAVTVDVMEEGRHLGGWIWPGIRAMLDAYRAVSPKLMFDLNPHVDLEKLPMKTRDAISFAILAPIKRVTERFAKGKRIVVTGGDAPIVAPLLPEAEIDETVIFKGMKLMLKEEEC